ncbi:hypothetical protein Ancab_029491 [Ancistrocladus abbreviatus]
MLPLPLAFSLLLLLMMFAGVDASTAAVVGGSVVGAIALLVVVCLIIWYVRVYKKRKPAAAAKDIHSATKTNLSVGEIPQHSNRGPSSGNPPTSGSPTRLHVPPGSAPNHLVLPIVDVRLPLVLHPGVSNISPTYSPSAMLIYAFEELTLATNGFSEQNLLGKGGFGSVYKGELPSGKLAAIKKLDLREDNVQSGVPSKRFFQGEREFQAEVKIISGIHHRNLVCLLGYCISGDQRLLVYEYMPNNSVTFHLRAGREDPRAKILDWATRMRIALGSAKGFAYLHEDCTPRVIHRDVKSNNILLDSNFGAKVSDFGLAQFFPDEDTHVSATLAGTMGYLAPEYSAGGKLTPKSDVYSFGVVLLELISGRSPLALVVWAGRLLAQALEDGKFEALVDPRLEKKYNYGEMERMVACAEACIRFSPEDRPNMSQVVRVLEGVMPLDDLKFKPKLINCQSSCHDAEYDRGEEDVQRMGNTVLKAEHRHKTF